MRALLVLTMLLLSGLAHADVALPPTGFADVFYLGFPGAIVAIVVIVGLSVLASRAIRKRGGSRRRATLAVVGIVVVGNLASYFYYMGLVRPAERRAQFEERERFRREHIPDGGS